MSTQIQIPGINQASTSPVSDTTFTTLTGTLTQTIVKILTIPANTLTIGNYWNIGNKDFGYVEAAINYAGTGATSMLVYMNNTTNLSGSPIQLGGGLSAAASAGVSAYAFGINSTSGGAANAMTRITSNTNVQNTSTAPLPGGYTNSTIFDITQPIYIIFAATLNNVGTTLSIGPAIINPLKKL
jgi:hypothetical protein